MRPPLLLGGGRRGEALPPLRPAALEYRPPGTGRHTLAEAMGAATSNSTGLIGALHWRIKPISKKKLGAWNRTPQVSRRLGGGQRPSFVQQRTFSSRFCGPFAAEWRQHHGKLRISDEMAAATHQDGGESKCPRQSHTLCSHNGLAQLCRSWPRSTTTTLNS
jgi:hypothetical protein